MTTTIEAPRITNKSEDALLEKDGSGNEANNNDFEEPMDLENAENEPFQREKPGTSSTEQVDEDIKDTIYCTKIRIWKLQW